MGPFPQCVVHGRHSINIWFTEEGHHIRCLFIEEYFSLYYLHKHLPLYHFFYSSYFHCEMERIGWKLKSQCYKGLIWRFYFQEDRIDILFPILPSKYNSKLWLYPHFTAEGTKGQWLPRVTNSKRHDLNSCPSSKSVLLITFVVWCFNNYSLVISMLFFSATYLLNDLGWVSSISSLFWGRGEQFQFLRKISNLYPKLTELTCETPCTHYTYTTTI